ncbi:DUF6177 family protein [Streptomyces sp. NBC_00083]|uniref:DUF6177 family protein n=1 Tax=Streptomyces sp. NBC_00083 TaxID=2975647 RepID=UPI0022571628|nr:DUF6177 family protein [Streptomyces sp. NBC_00083]MCX5385661.1 DUF6177 family protein [Streptomyces sp. NBC_00083]
MTKDVIALTPKMPDTWALLAGLYAGGPGLTVDTGNDGAVVQLCTADGRPLVSLEAPLLMQVPGEAERLLGGDVAPPELPYWWTEARASTAAPEAERLAGSVVGRLTTLLGGAAWPPGAATTDVVPVAAEGELSARPVSGGAHPTVDVLTESTAVVMCDRPLIALTAWLSHILRAAVESRRALQIVTPPGVRLSLPLRTALTGAPNRWVVKDPACGYYDGLSGAVLRWQDGTFAPARDAAGRAVVAEAFSGGRDGVAPGGAAPSGSASGGADAGGSGRQLIVAFRTLHNADENLTLGRALEAAWAELTGSAPAGWGTAEPINLPWSTRQLTDLARERAPEPTQLLAVGDPARPALAGLRVTRVEGGVSADATLTLGYGADETVPLDAIQALATTLAASHGLANMFVSLRRGRRDLAVPARLEAPPVPVSYTLGAEGVRAAGLDRALRPPLALRPVRVGADAAPSVHYVLGDGEDVGAWAVLEHLTAHLEPAAARP